MAADEKEYELAQLMKQKYCDELGKEQNVEETAKVFHQIGLLYRKAWTKSPSFKVLVCIGAGSRGQPPPWKYFGPPGRLAPPLKTVF